MLHPVRPAADPSTALTRPLRVAVLASWTHPVTEPFPGGLEAHVWHLCRGLLARGHEVVLHARAGSDPAVASELAEFDELWEPSMLAHSDVSMPEPGFMREHHAYLDALERIRLGGADLVHNHAYHYLPMSLGGRDRTSWVTTLHTPPTPWLESAMAARRTTTMTFTTVSGFTATQWSRLPTTPSVVPNGVDPKRWPQGPGGDALVWSGRITSEKAPHMAVEAAVRAGRRLVLAGPVRDQDYFDTRIRPRLGSGVEYAGHLHADALAALVGSSAAALVTPAWDEPFGLVAAEALMCGTPVAAFARGGLPEVLGPLGSDHLAFPGDVDSLAAAADRAASADRGAVRADAVARFGIDRMIDAYERLYTTLTARRSGAAPVTPRVRTTRLEPPGLG